MRTLTIIIAAALLTGCAGQPSPKTLQIAKPCQHPVADTVRLAGMIVTTMKCLDA